MGIIPYAIFTKFGLGRESQVRNLLPNFTVMVIEEVRPIFAPSNFFDAINSFTARGY